MLRHGETINNVLAMISREDYETKRSHEPELSQIGSKACLLMGEAMGKAGFKIDKVLCSGQKRAILTAKHWRQGYLESSKRGENVDIQLMVRCHERGGCYQGTKVFPGLNKIQMQELCEDIIVNEDQDVTDTKGWHENRKEVETTAEFHERVKEVVRDWKEMHKFNKDKTFLCISHGCFLRVLMLTLTCQMSLLCDNFHPKNNSLTILDFIDVKNPGTNTEYVDVKIQAFNLQLIDEV